MIGRTDLFIFMLLDAFEREALCKDSLFERRICEYITHAFLHEAPSVYEMDSEGNIIDIVDDERSYRLLDYKTVSEFLDEPTYFDPSNPNDMPERVFYWFDVVEYRISEGIFYFGLEYLEANREALAPLYRDYIDAYLSPSNTYFEFYENLFIGNFQARLGMRLSEWVAKIMCQPFPFFIKKYAEGADKLQGDIEVDNKARERLSRNIEENRKKYSSSIERRLRLMGLFGIRYVHTMRKELQWMLNKLLSDSAVSMEAVLCAVLHGVITMDDELRDAVMDDLTLKIISQDTDRFDWYF